MLVFPVPPLIVLKAIVFMSLFPFNGRILFYTAG